MKAIDTETFKKVMAGLTAIYGVEPSTALMDGYWLALKDWPVDAFEKAAVLLLRTSKFMPRPADFNATRAALRPTSGEAWLKVMEHIKSGNYRDPSASWSQESSVGIGDEQIDKVARMVGGYYKIAYTKFDDLKYIEARFLEHYKTVEESTELRGVLEFKPRDLLK